MTPEDVAICREMADLYRFRGFNPLPSRMDEKRPMLKFADLWDRPLSKEEFERFATGNIQVMTGRHWGLLVVDLDGPEAVGEFASMGSIPRTWVSHSGGGGRHVWFSIPKVGRPLPKVFLWRGDGKHEAIERLCDKSLVMAPPSIHPKTGRRYRWRDVASSPRGVGKPAPCPAWVLNLAPVPAPGARAPSSGVDRPGRDSAPRIDWREAISRLDVPSLVRAWGLKTVGSPRSSGWLPCHAFGREDEHPSAAIHVESGYYVDSGSGERMSLFDLAAAMNAYGSREEAFKELGGRYGRTA